MRDVLEKLILWSKAFIALCFSFPVIPIAIGGILLILLVFGFVKSCNTKQEEKKIERIEANIQAANAEIRVIENTKKTIENTKRDVEKTRPKTIENRKAANTRLNDSINRGSNEYNGQSAGDKFCAAYPLDPSCQ